MKPTDSEGSPDAPALTIRISELADLFNTLCQHLIESGYDSVVIPHDYYWHIDPSDRYDPTKSPTSMSLGQLYEDWAELSRIQRGDSEAIGYALVWFAAIIEYIGERTVS